MFDWAFDTRDKRSWWHPCIGSASDSVALPLTTKACPDCGARKENYQ